jgi:hypothetical protein
MEGVPSRHYEEWCAPLPSPKCLSYNTRRAMKPAARHGL